MRNHDAIVIGPGQSGPVCYSAWVWKWHIAPFRCRAAIQSPFSARRTSPRW